MVIKIIYISKNTCMRCRASLRFTVTYHFGHRTCNSEPILLKIVSKDAHFLGVYYGMLNRFEPVFIGPVRGGFYRFLFSKGSNCNRSGPVQIGSVRSGFGLFPVHRTGPSNTKWNNRGTYTGIETSKLFRRAVINLRLEVRNKAEEFF